MKPKDLKADQAKGAWYRLENGFSRAMDDLFDPVAKRINDAIIKNEDGTHGRGFYKCIHFRCEAFVRLMEQLLASGKLRYRAPNHNGRLNFVDVGCGVGQKLWIIRHLYGEWFKSHGIEYNPELAAEAKKVYNDWDLENRENTIHVGDALKFKDWGRFDVIYFYRPIANDKLMVKLEQKIMAGASSGTIALVVSPRAFHNKETLEKYGWKALEDVQYAYIKS